MRLNTMNRRDILKTAGCTLFLPSLESFGQNPTAKTEAEVKRLFCVSMGYGFFTDTLRKAMVQTTHLVTTWSL